ncbi:MAG TPA: GNAT family N-acetyltransferase [Pyrinomonadaceae bacterium]|nr:GNAT family N-acetyltransferase [Pyrinomonadaceae bacterium]
MITLKRTNSDDTDFQNLVRELDKELAIRDGAEHAYYAQFNKIDAIKYVVVAYENEVAVGCGAIKSFDGNSMEVKRMFVPLESRGKGIASKVLQELEKWTAELDYAKCVLETGYKQPEAIALYRKNGYSQIPNYGQYIGMDNSICFEKVIEK